MSQESLLHKLELINVRYEEVGKQIVDPDIISDMKRYVRLTKEYKDLEPIVKAYLDLRNTVDNIKSSLEIIKTETDPEFKDMAKMELDDLQKKQDLLNEEIKWLLIPKDPNDDKNVIMEFRAGTGGDEACIFVEDVFRMYTMYFKEKGYAFSIVNSNTGSSGYKEISMEVSGEEVYGTLKFESGVHRVQRVPETESQGRVHTSAITVAVLPEAEEIDFTLDTKDIRKDTFRASGAGGQHVNKTESAVRLRHLPSGVVVECQEQRSQHKNRDKAMQMLKSELYKLEIEKRNAAKAEVEGQKQKIEWGSQIRSYVLDDKRIKDHRSNHLTHNVKRVLDGDIDDFLKATLMALKNI